MGKLKVTVVNGIELKDVNLIGTIDPFCKCYLEQDPDNKKVTNPIDNTRNPSWNYSTEFYIDTRKLQALNYNLIIDVDSKGSLKVYPFIINNFFRYLIFYFF